NNDVPPAPPREVRTGPAARGPRLRRSCLRVETDRVPRVGGAGLWGREFRGYTRRKLEPPASALPIRTPQYGPPGRLSPRLACPRAAPAPRAACKSSARLRPPGNAGRRLPQAAAGLRHRARRPG